MLFNFHVELNPIRANGNLIFPKNARNDQKMSLLLLVSDIFNIQFSKGLIEFSIGQKKTKPRKKKNIIAMPKKY